MICAGTFHRLWHAPPMRASEQVARRWLSPAELETLAELGDVSRRRAWFAGRMLVKRILLEELLPSVHGYEVTGPADIEIVSRDGLGRAVRPRAIIGGRQQPWRLSLAHGEDSVFAAASNDENVSVGVDLVPRAIGRRGFAECWLTSRERRAWGRLGDPLRLAENWAVKEAVYKAAGQGESFQPTSYEVLPAENGLTCSWNGSAQFSIPRIEFFDADPHLGVLVTLHKIQSEAIA